MYGCESWNVKKVGHQRIDAFELWCWRRLLRVPWTTRRSNQFILKKISPEYSLEGLILKLKLQYFCHLMWRTDSFEKTLMLKKIEGRRRRGRQRMRWLDGITNTQWTWVESSPRVSDGRGGLACCSPWGCRVGHDWATELIWKRWLVNLTVVWSLNRVWLFCDPIYYSPPGSSDHGDSPGKNIGGGCRFLPPGDLPGSGIESTCPALAGRFFNAEPPKKLG